MKSHEQRPLSQLNKIIEKRFNTTKRRLLALNFGCGHQILNDNKKVYWLNLEMYKDKGVNIVHDLDKYPYPFKDNTFDVVFANMVLEHLDSKIKPIEELWRIIKPNGIIFAIVPYYNSKGALTHIDHKQFFDEGTYKRFDGLNHRDLHASKTKVRFEINYKLFCIGRFRRFLPFKKLFNMFLHNVYNELWFELRVVK